MKTRAHVALACGLALLLAVLLVPSPVALAADKSEEELLALLDNPDEGKVTKAMLELERKHSDSEKAKAKISSMVRDPREKVRRKAARVLGAIHAKVDAKTLDGIAALLSEPGKDTVIDGLKALRSLAAGSTVPKIVPLLSSPDENIKRDACRTLAEIADKKVIPKIEPLLSDPNKKVVEDARKAISELKDK